MILLERGNRILGETVSAKINHDAEEKVEPIDVRLCDFDDVQYRVVIDPEKRNILQVSMNLPCYSAIEKLGAKDAFTTIYGPLVTTALPSFDVTVAVDLDTLKEQKAKDEMVERLSCLKANTLGGFFDFYCTHLLKGTNAGAPFKFDLRFDTTIYVFPKADRVVIIFSIDFKDKVDRAIAKIFMQEFVEAKRTLGAAPPVAFGVNPPSDLATFSITQPTGNLGFVSFALLKSHVDNNKKQRVVDVLASFRNYLQYHIKCSKSHFHARMRARVVALLAVLNRAKVDADERVQPTSKTTMGGKTFIRQ